MVGKGVDFKRVDFLVCGFKLEFVFGATVGTTVARECTMGLQHFQASCGGMIETIPLCIFVFMCA